MHLGAKSGIDFAAQLSDLLDESENLELLSDMMIQPATPHFQHPRQPQQNYGHASMNSYRQGYHAHHHQVRILGLAQFSPLYDFNLTTNF